VLAEGWFAEFSAITQRESVGRRQCDDSGMATPYENAVITATVTPRIASSGVT
jgi:hypothetical protein